jgi:NitT/TauT family transport system ATP-binding protein
MTSSAPERHSEFFVELEGVTLSYGRGEKQVNALGETNLRLKQGDFVALVGPSGCGKSTILKLVTGLLNASTGYVYVAGREVGAEPVRVGMAFQNPTMLPWLTVRDNVMMPLKIVPPFREQYRAKRKTEFRDRAQALLEEVGLGQFGDKQPWQLSGGMLQRASLCRALVHEPQLLMLDEPFGALDAFTREELWGVLQELWMQRRFTCILVTHDLREAVYLADVVHVMSARPGRVIATHRVDLPRPRTIESTFNSDFIDIVHAIRGEIAHTRNEDKIALAKKDGAIR